ncbi:PREDICTED: alpha,alpha-trehalose-phosphate synthase [UDP-forming] [Papilio polytes]|uniref:alpha,alpha-trehalose-phosphate synthase [UDP-forming] n=1 Tax=Papilio polytes TaxID=76194 RepID=UPI000675F535|nr:PREDICTED: alpha,alpha-trehalose-phosphate synthase [UDP-forming] [Papilio polytes]
MSVTSNCVSRSTCNSKGSMIVVSNRLPFVLKRNDKTGELERKASAGGLVTAVAPVVIRGKGIWVGWPGIHLDNPNEKIPESDPNDKTPTAGLLSSKSTALWMDRWMFDSYYNGCCNGTFWPLFHSMPDRATFIGDNWKAYIKINEEFADKTVHALHLLQQESKDKPCSPPIVWVHDYHLMLAANWIRQRVEEDDLKCKLAFFLHIPFPPWDIFRLFPWSDEVLQGILGCDMVGFHITDYCLNFIDCCQRNLGCRVDRKNLLVELGGRTICVRPLPIGVPFDRFVQLAQNAKAVLSTSQKVILGVDRLDYTKGLVHRLKAFERLLEKHPEHIEKVVLLQISVPSRTDVKEYQDLKEEMDQLVGRINGRFTTPNWSPIRYIYGCVGQDELAAFYRDAAVALVTPLRDGMNLVAKEFVACQINKPPGVLIVSPFAGAGEMMHEGLFQVGIEGITYAGNHGLEILHPDGSKFVHPMPMELQDKVVDLLKSLQEQVKI